MIVNRIIVERNDYHHTIRIKSITRWFHFSFALSIRHLKLHSYVYVCVLCYFENTLTHSWTDSISVKNVITQKKLKTRKKYFSNVLSI